MQRDLVLEVKGEDEFLDGCKQGPGARVVKVKPGIVFCSAAKCIQKQDGCLLRHHAPCCDAGYALAIRSGRAVTRLSGDGDAIVHDMHFACRYSQFNQCSAAGLIDCDHTIRFGITAIRLTPIRLSEFAGDIMPMSVSKETTSRFTHCVDPRNGKIEILTQDNANAISAKEAFESVVVDS